MICAIYKTDEVFNKISFDNNDKCNIRNMQDRQKYGTSKMGYKQYEKSISHGKVNVEYSNGKAS